MERDWVEADYLGSIYQAARRGDNDRAQELSVGLQQYRELYQVDRRDATAHDDPDGQ